MLRIRDHALDDIISVENLLAAWREFLRGKRGRPGVDEFGRDLFGNVSRLSSELRDRTYRHGGYAAFRISDPKPRLIHKASVRDRLLCHAIYRVLYPPFDRQFVSDSFSCRVGKGTHRAMARFQTFARQVSRNGTRTAWALKCDVRKFFATIDHGILLAILRRYTADAGVLWLLETVIRSFSTAGTQGKGLPLGNLTSQLLVNVYMSEFDWFVKRDLGAARYARYADDFVFLDERRDWLLWALPKISAFLRERLALDLHPDKVHVQTLASGVDFLGWVHFPDHRVIRPATRRRMERNLAGTDDPAVRKSYSGLLRHGNTWKLRERFGLWPRPF